MKLLRVDANGTYARVCFVEGGRSMKFVRLGSAIKSNFAKAAMEAKRDFIYDKEGLPGVAAAGRSPVPASEMLDLWASFISKVNEAA